MALLGPQQGPHVSWKTSLVMIGFCLYPSPRVIVRPEGFIADWETRAQMRVTQNGELVLLGQRMNMHLIGLGR